MSLVSPTEPDYISCTTQHSHWRISLYGHSTIIMGKGIVKESYENLIIVRFKKKKKNAHFL